MPKLTTSILKKMINEELHRLNEGEAESREAELSVKDAANNLLTALEKFEKTVKDSPLTKNVISKMSPHFEGLKTVLKNVFDQPKEFVSHGPASPDQMRPGVTITKKNVKTKVV